MQHVSTTWRSSWKAMKEAIAFAQAHWLSVFWIILGQVILSAVIYWFYQAVNTGEGVYVQAYGQTGKTVIDTLAYALYAGYTVFSTLAIISLVKSPTLSFGELLTKEVFPKLVGGIIITVIWSLTTIFGAALLVVPGLIVFLFLLFALQVYVVDGGKVKAAFTQSYKLIRGWWWPVLGRFLTMLTVVVVISLFGIVPGTGVTVSGVLFVLFTPVFVIYLTQTYLELKAAKQKNPQFAYSYARKGLLIIMALVLFSLLTAIFSLTDFVLEVMSVA